MSAYKDFVVDFPMRCFELFEAFEPEAEFFEREVTMLLMAAAAAFVISYERIRPNSRIDHPAKNKEQFEVATELKNVFEDSFLSSRFAGSGNWSKGIALFSYGDFQPQNEAAIQVDTILVSVLSTIRNALAHGNVYTNNNKEIETLYFVSYNKKKQEHRFVAVSPAGFKEFLRSWAKFLQENNSSIPEIQEIIEEAVQAQQN